jgi:hypothetical protein
MPALLHVLLLLLPHLMCQHCPSALVLLGTVVVSRVKVRPPARQQQQQQQAGQANKQAVGVQQWVWQQAVLQLEDATCRRLQTVCCQWMLNRWEQET